MKISIIGTGSFNSPLTIRPRGLAKHLAASGHHVTLIVPSADKYNQFKPQAAPSQPKLRVVQPWQLASRSLVLNLVPYLCTMPFALLRSQPDVIIIAKATPITIGGLVGRLFGKTVIVDSDDLGSEVMRAEGQSRLVCSLVSLSERLANRFCSASVVVSSLLQREFTAKYPAKPVLLLPNGVEAADYHPNTTSKLRPAAYYFGVINRLEVIEPFLRAIPSVHAAIPTAQFTIIGDGKALDAAQALAKSLHIDSVVRFPGWQSDMLAVQNFVQFGDLGICYQSDTRPVQAASNMKVFQYMAMGSVPIVNTVGDLPAYVQHNSQQVAAANQTDNLAAVIINLLANPKLRSTLAKSSLILARQEYSWQHHAVQLTDFITSLTSPAAQGKVAIS